jgi:hypothetical protein
VRERHSLETRGTESAHDGTPAPLALRYSAERVNPQGVLMSSQGPPTWLSLREAAIAN